MEVNNILVAKSLDELKALGGYLEIKKSLEKEIDNKLGVKGWEQLFYKVEFLKKSIPIKKNIILRLNNERSLEESKNYISRALVINVTAKSWEDFDRKLKMLVSVFCFESFEPHAYYEKTKLKKFKDSSRLEGINVDLSDRNASLESVLERYRR